MKTIEFIETDANAVTSKFGLYVGPARSGRTDGSVVNAVRTTPPLVREMLFSCKSEDIGDIVVMLEVIAARTISALLSDGMTGQYYGLSYENSRRAFAQYGINVVRYDTQKNR